jgi:glycosyltransferase involved in cell wall biosynthesis
MEPQLVSVVLVTWNSAQYLRRCLEGLRQQTHHAVELIAIDNASSDDSAALVEPHAQTLIRNDTNRGFSAAVNQGIAASRGAYVLLHVGVVPEQLVVRGGDQMDFAAEPIDIVQHQFREVPGGSTCGRQFSPSRRCRSAADDPQPAFPPPPKSST